MKRFFLLILVTLLLCQNVSASQTEPKPQDETNTAALMAEKQDAADESPQPHQKQTDKKDDDVIGGQSPALIERVKEFATIPNAALLISVFATIFAGLSWLAGRGANKAAWAAVKVSQQSAFDGLRAYISVESITAVTIDNGILVVIVIKNVGQTPAKNAKMHRCFQVGSHEDIMRLRPNHIKPTEHNYGSIASDGVRNGRIEFTQNALSQWPMTKRSIVKGEKLILIDGWVEYEDIYDRPHATFFRGHIAGVTAENYVVQIASDGNEMT